MWAIAPRNLDVVTNLPHMKGMIRQFFNDLFQGDAAQADEISAQVALAALMVRVARSDDHYTDSEAQMISACLRDRFGGSLEDATALRIEAEEVEENAPDTVRFTKLVKDIVPYEDRVDVVAALWKVALADGTRSADEDGFLRLVANLLGVNDRDSAYARQSVSQ